MESLERKCREGFKSKSSNSMTKIGEIEPPYAYTKNWREVLIS